MFIIQLWRLLKIDFVWFCYLGIVKYEHLKSREHFCSAIFLNNRFFCGSPMSPCRPPWISSGPGTSEARAKHRPVARSTTWISALAAALVRRGSLDHRRSLTQIKQPASAWKRWENRRRKVYSANHLKSSKHGGISNCYVWFPEGTRKSVAQWYYLGWILRGNLTPETTPFFFEGPVGYSVLLHPFPIRKQRGELVGKILGPGTPIGPSWVVWGCCSLLRFGFRCPDAAEQLPSFTLALGKCKEKKRMAHIKGRDLLMMMMTMRMMMMKETCMNHLAHLNMFHALSRSKVSPVAVNIEALEDVVHVAIQINLLGEHGGPTWAINPGPKTYHTNDSFGFLSVFEDILRAYSWQWYSYYSWLQDYLNILTILGETWRNNPTSKRIMLIPGHATRWTFGIPQEMIQHDHHIQDGAPGL